ncbi:MAG TPA: TIR domain-containing protein [Chitinophagaceae bacterium]|nr:TIR domain-containing protein [Chitinophagaceae bacterium]
MADIFISYSSEDKTIVQKIASLLEEKNWTVWWDRKIPLGEAYDLVIETELEEAKCVLVIWTKRSVQSEWVRNEALEASSNKKLVPVILESVKIPLVFKRIESAMMIDWDGDKNHSELELLYQAIDNILNGKPQNENDDEERGQDNEIKNGVINKASIKTWILIAFGIGLLFLLGYFLIINLNKKSKIEDNNFVIRVLNPKRERITQGDVKIYLDEFSREQRLDRTGQALFSGLPNTALQKKIRIELSSPGYETSVIDTILSSASSIDLFLAYAKFMSISGRIKTADEIPIKDVEISIDGTKYTAISNTDGSYQIKYNEYTIGDEITLTTSHEQYKDKTIPIKISSAEQSNLDIFLSPTNK